LQYTAAADDLGRRKVSKPRWATTESSSGLRSH
jgi:hypothetical protein